MRFLHVADLHLGRRLGEMDLADDQAHILGQILGLARQHAVDAVLVAGDVYDRTVPSAAAMQLLDGFFTSLAAAGLPAYIISGNHDSADRLAFGGRLMEGRGVHLAAVYAGRVPSYRLHDAHGPLTLWALPFLKPGLARCWWPDEDIPDYTAAVRAVLAHAGVEPGERCVLLAHQFVTAGGRAPRPGGSEAVNVGTLDNVDASVFAPFDYVALGHIHSAQQVGGPRVRYCGAPLKYSVDEARGQKCALLVELAGKGQLSVTPLPLAPLRELRRVQGPLQELLLHGERTGDYVHAVLTDDAPLTDAAARLRAVYPNLVKIDFTYARARLAAQPPLQAQALAGRTPLELFDEFYASVHGRAMDGGEAGLMRQVFGEVEP